MNPIDQLSKFSTATICEALGNNNYLPSAIKPISKTMKVCGPAFTVKTMPRDNILLHRAYATASIGDVIIADCSGFYEAGYWGDLLSLGAMQHGIKGLVIDGCVRDADDIEKLAFPVFSRGLCIRGTSNHGDGTLNEPVIIGNVLIHPGDIVVGDRDGVVIVPFEKIEITIEKALAREQKEEQTRIELRKGRPSIEIYGWKEKYNW